VNRSTTILATLIVALLAMGSVAVAAQRVDAGAAEDRPTMMDMDMDMDAMHGSAEMRAMHEQMPADLAAQCDAMHAGMAEHMGEGMGQMMPSMMDEAMGEGMRDQMPAGMPMPGGDHAQHHPAD
jgi:hypothetical protein